MSGEECDQPPFPFPPRPAGSHLVALCLRRADMRIFLCPHLTRKVAQPGSLLHLALVPAQRVLETASSALLHSWVVSTGRRSTLNSPSSPSGHCGCSQHPAGTYGAAMSILVERCLHILGRLSSRSISRGGIAGSEDKCKMRSVSFCHVGPGGGIGLLPAEARGPGLPFSPAGGAVLVNHFLEGA